MGHLASLQEFDLTDCSSLKELPESMLQLQRLQWLLLGGCTSLPEASPGFVHNAMCYVDEHVCLHMPWGMCYLGRSSSSPRSRIRRILAKQTQHRSVGKLATQQEPMLATLERLSWLVLLLATATFTAFLMPPGGMDEDQLLVSNVDQCTSWQLGTQAFRRCAAIVFFVLDVLSFGLSMGTVVMIVILSMPRLQYADKEVEAGRFWALLLATWALFYAAVLSGFGAFLFSGLAVYNKAGMVLGPLAPGALLMVLGLVEFIRRFKAIHPGWHVVVKGLWPGYTPLQDVEEEQAADQRFLMSQQFWGQARDAMAAAMAAGAAGAIQPWPQQHQQQQPQQQEEHVRDVELGVYSSAADEGGAGAETVPLLARM
jgi:hypothetical protein